MKYAVRPFISHPRRSRPTIEAVNSISESNYSSPFEVVVRSVTKNKDYKFGDFTKNVTAMTEVAVQKITGNEDYQFGDFSKQISNTSIRSLEVAVRSVSNNENYKFGDLTKQALSDAELMIGGLKEDTLKLIWKDRLTEAQRRDVVANVIRLAATAVLSYSFTHNFQIACMYVASSVLSFRGQPFIETYSKLHLALDIPLLPIRASFAVLIAKFYLKSLNFLENKVLSKKDDPLTNRIIAVVILWAGVNCICVSGLAQLAINLYISISRAGTR